MIHNERSETKENIHPLSGMVLGIQEGILSRPERMITPGLGHRSHSAIRYLSNE